MALSLLVISGVAGAELEDKLEALDNLLVGIYDGDPATLDECIEVALAGNASLGQFEENVGTSEVARQRAIAAWLPSISASASWQKSERTDYDSPIFGAGPDPIGEEDVVSKFKNTSGRADANLVLFDGFGRFAGNKRAGAELDADEATLEYQRTLIVQNVANRYMDLVKAIRTVEVALESEDVALKELERSETYFELGISTKSDVLQQKVNYQNTKLTTVVERNTERNAFVLLAHSMGIPSSQRFDVEVVIPGADEMIVPELDPLIDTARENRLDLEASEKQVEGRDASVTEAKSGLYPSISAFMSYSRSNSQSPQSLRLGAQLNDSWSYGFQGSWNIFDRFQTKDAKQRAIAARRVAEYNLRVAELVAEAEVVSIHNNLTEASERHDVAAQTVEQAEEDLRLAQERFRVGAGTSLDVINAQVQLSRARRDVVDAQTDYVKFRHQLRRATGQPIR